MIMASQTEAPLADVGTPPSRTELVYQHDAKRYTLPTKVIAVLPYASLPAASRALFKKAQEEGGEEGSAAYHAVVTSATIFHPQGGGQPSDVGAMTAATSVADGEESGSTGATGATGTTGASGTTTFHVLSARMDAVRPGQVLHFGRFCTDSGPNPASPFEPGSTVHQAIDVDKRILYSRFHTAGHVLGAAVRHLVESEIEGFDELKASHFPDSASCEFRGRIEAHWKDPVQARVAEYVAKAMPVEIDWWDAADFRRHGLERLMPQPAAPSSTDTAAPGGPTPQAEKWRIVRIVGAEVYPCGGTHVDTTDLCGETRVTKISRSKGVSRVSYTLAGSGKA